MRKIKINFVAIFLSVSTLWSCSDKNVVLSSKEAGEFKTTMRVPANVERFCRIDKDDASLVALRFIAGTDEKLSTVTVKSVDSILDENNRVAMYVVNFLPCGYVITSADVRNEPIFSYSTQHYFSKINENTPDALISLIEKTTDVNNWIQGMGDSVPVNMIGANVDEWNFYMRGIEKWETQFVRIRIDILNREIYPDYDPCKRVPPVYLGDSILFSTGIFLNTKWDQGEPYDYYIPHHYPVGCTAVALAQIMKFHQHPNSFNWSIMPDSIRAATYSDMTDGDREVARLLRETGKAIATIYSSGGSFALPYGAFLALINRYGYSRGARFGGFNYSELENEIKNNRRPVLIGGLPPKGYGKYTMMTSGGDIKNGHSFVVDGYQEIMKKLKNCKDEIYYSDSNTFIHINFGWGNECTTWYGVWRYFGKNNNISDIQLPHELNYKYNRQCVYRIYK